MNRRRFALVFSLMFLLRTDALSAVGFEGFGSGTTGGVGGDIYQVTNLKADGPGSLRYAFTSKATPDAPRIVRFQVAGWLDHPVTFNNPAGPFYKNMGLSSLPANVAATGHTWDDLTE